MINLEKEIREQPAVLARVKDTNMDTIRAIVADIKAGNITNVLFAARGTSDHACIYAQYLMHRFIGIPCALATPSTITAYQAEMKLEHTLVIGVSQSGKAADVLAVLENGKKCGTITVAVTNDVSSPMAQSAKYHLYCNAGEEKSIAATKTFTAQMMLLALLCAEWSGNDKLFAQLDQVSAGASEVLDTVPAQVERIISRYRYMEDAFVLGRGMAYPIALEGALKILETNKIRVRGYASSDFQHGPLAQVSEKTLVFVIAPQGPCMKDAEEMIQKIESIGAELIVVTDDAALAQKQKFAIQVPNHGCDCVAPYFMAMVMQLFALKLTEVKGIDPDQSNVLKKITITK